MARDIRFQDSTLRWRSNPDRNDPARDPIPADHALVVTASEANSEEQFVRVNETSPRTTRPAAFLAHLVATQQDVPQTRNRRRADPSDAASLYLAALSRETDITPTRTVSRMV